MKNKNIIRFGGATLLAAGLAFAQSSSGLSGQSQPSGQPEQSTPQMAKPGDGRYGEAMRERMMTELNLTPDQRTKANGIWDRARREAEPLTRELRQNRQNLAAAIKADDTAKIRELSMQRGRLVGDMTAIHSQARARFYSILTAEQKTKADQMHAQFEERMRERWHERTGTEENQ
jgi:Spy/CpxP family protein refolding chaperone